MELNKRTNKKLTTVEPDMKIIGIYRWFPHEIYQLIDLVKENQAIYNPTDKNYFCRRFVENVWRDIDIKLKKNPGSSLAKWTNLRICFRREYASFLVDAVKPLWVYFDKMFFLHPYLRKKRPNSEHLESRIQEALEQINSSMTRARHNIRNCVKNIECPEPEHDPELLYDERESYMNGGDARISDDGGDRNGDIMKLRHYDDDNANRNNNIIEYVAESDDDDDEVDGNVGNDDYKNDDDDNLSIKNELIDAENNNDDTKTSDIESLTSVSQSPDTCRDSENNSNSNNLSSSINQINQNESQAIKQQSSSSSPSSSVLAVALKNHKRGHLKRKYESTAAGCGTSSSLTRNNANTSSSSSSGSSSSSSSKLMQQNSICKSVVAKDKEICKKSKMKGHNNPEQEQENRIDIELNNHSLEQHQDSGGGGDVIVPDSEFFINKSQKKLKISKNDCTTDDTRTKTINNNNSSIENLTTTTTTMTTNELCNCKLDPDAMFLMSLLPDVKSLSRKDKGKFKIEIQNLIQNYLYPESN